MERDCEMKGVPLGSGVLPFKNPAIRVRSMPTEYGSYVKMRRGGGLLCC